MRRLATTSVVLLLLAAFLAAWVNAQEGLRRRPRPKASMSDGGELQLVGARSGAPRQLTLADDAQPIEGEALPDEVSPQQNTIRALAGPADEPEEADPISGRRPLRGGSRLGPTVMPATPATNIDGELSSDDGSTNIVSPNMPSVLKKKAGTPPTPSSAKTESRLTPATIGTGEPVDGTGSSRRMAPQDRTPAVLDESAGIPALSSRPSVPTKGTLRAPGATASAQSGKLQLIGAAPRLVVQAIGPPAITVGKPAAYQIHVANDSSAAAEGVDIRIGLPPWVQVRGGEGSRGEAKQEKDAAGRQWLVWSMPDLAASGKEQLSLELIVQQNQPFELALQSSVRPTTAAAEIAVREPQVEVRLEGPSDMLFGEQKNFTLHVSNPGTGDAENVAVEVSSGGGQPNRLDVGLLAAGQQKQIPFIVAATAPGEMEIRAAASGANGLSAEAVSRVVVHKAELQVAMDVPPLKFAGAESTYQVAVANVGDAIAEQVTLSIALPVGAKYLGGFDGAAKVGEGLALKIGNLPANSEKVFEIRCVLTQAGQNQFQITAQGKGELLSSTTAMTQVEALADLKLQVTEPTGPVPVGSDAMYEVKVTNRGTKSAEKVKVVVQFGRGLEPVEAIGGAAALTNGQATFEPLPEIAAGQEVVLKVKAKTEQAGNHAFRVEVKCGEPETRLVSEGVTRAFSESSGGRAVARKPGPLKPSSVQPGTLQPAPATKIR